MEGYRLNDEATILQLYERIKKAAESGKSLTLSAAETRAIAELFEEWFEEDYYDDDFDDYDDEEEDDDDL